MTKKPVKATVIDSDNDNQMIVPHRPISELINLFSQVEAKKKKDSDSDFDSLLLVARRLFDLYSYRPFGEVEFHQLAQSLDLDYQSQKTFFNKLIKFLISNHCVREIPSLDGGLYEII